MSYLWKVVGVEGFSSAQSAYISMKFSAAGKPYVAYKDYGNQSKATVMTFDGQQWRPAGIAGFSAGEVWFTSLDFSSSGQAFIAYEDAGNNYKATVMTLNGSSWVPVGSPGFSPGIANYTCIALPPAEPSHPCLAFTDGSHSNKASVMKFNGTSWVYLGNPGFSAGEADFISFAFSPTGDPYIAYQDHGNSQKATVRKFNGTSWQDVGEEGFSEGPANYIDLKFSPAGIPFIAYWDEIAEGTVRKFIGSHWVNADPGTISTGEAHYLNLAFTPNGSAFLSYIDIESYHIPKVLGDKIYGWEPADSAGVSSDWADYTSLACSPAGSLYVAFEDGAYSNRLTVKKLDSLYVGIRNQELSTLVIYPNPASNSICVSLPVEYGIPESIEIYGVLGAKIFASAIRENNTSLDIRDFPPGIYFVRIKSRSKEYTGKFCRI
ncbi:MAG: T9SS type A sorting domain-containing protein [Bacteroidetes bacterium]|nr:T9SS type A sorting domain-containing protein [Bacteroidota bacterium]